MAACDKRQKASETGEEGSSSKRKWKSRVDKVRQWRHLPVIHFIFCVLGPNIALLVCIVLFTLHTKQVYSACSERLNQLQQLCIPIGRLAFELTNEREASATYTTARQPSDRQLLEQLWNDLTAARDDVTAALNLLPPSHRSRSLVLSAILKRHRAETRIGQNFIDDIQFYTNVIESTIDWLKTDSDGQWMTIYGHLLNSANFLTGEQSLCNAFNSLVCFSHRERLFYVNYTFTGEATFRLYRRAYNSADNIDVGVLEKTLSDHAAIFPALARCRRDVVQDINYYSVSPEHHTICDQSRRNASRVREVNDLLVQEMDIMIKRAVEQTKIGVSTAYTRYVIISWLLAIAACYGLAVVSLNVGSLICHSIRQNRRRKELEFQALCVDDSCCKELHKRGMEKAHVSGTLPEDTKRLNGNGYAVLLPSVVTNSYCTSARSNGPIHVATPTIDCLLLDSKYATKSEDNNDFVHNCHIKIATV